MRIPKNNFNRSTINKELIYNNVWHCQDQRTYWGLACFSNLQKMYKMHIKTNPFFTYPSFAFFMGEILKVFNRNLNIKTNPFFTYSSFTFFLGEKPSRFLTDFFGFVLTYTVIHIDRIFAFLSISPGTLCNGIGYRYEVYS